MVTRGAKRDAQGPNLYQRGTQDVNRVSLPFPRHSDSFLSAFIGGSAAEELRKAQSRSAKRKEVGSVPCWTITRRRQPWPTLFHALICFPKGSGRKRHDFSSPTTPKVYEEGNVIQSGHWLSLHVSWILSPKPIQRGVGQQSAPSPLSAEPTPGMKTYGRSFKRCSLCSTRASSMLGRRFNWPPAPPPPPVPTATRERAGEVELQHPAGAVKPEPLRPIESAERAPVSVQGGVLCVLCIIKRGAACPRLTFTPRATLQSTPTAWRSPTASCLRSSSIRPRVSGRSDTTAAPVYSSICQGRPTPTRPTSAHRSSGHAHG